MKLIREKIYYDAFEQTRTKSNPLGVRHVRPFQCHFELVSHENGVIGHKNLPRPPSVFLHRIAAQRAEMSTNRLHENVRKRNVHTVAPGLISFSLKKYGVVRFTQRIST